MKLGIDWSDFLEYAMGAFFAVLFGGLILIGLFALISSMMESPFVFTVVVIIAGLLLMCVTIGLILARRDAKRRDRAQV